MSLWFQWFARTDNCFAGDGAPSDEVRRSAKCGDGSKTFEVPRKEKKESEMSRTVVGSQLTEKIAMVSLVSGSL